MKNQDSKTVIKFSAWGSQSEIEYLLPLIEHFEQENPDIKIEFLHIPQNYFQKLHLLFASKLAPDVVFVNNHYFIKYVNANLLEDLSKYIDKSKYFSQSIDCFTVNNKIYAIPRDISNLVVYYNKNLFDKYNINYPNNNWTHYDYVNIANSFHKNGIWGVGYETDTMFLLPFLLSNDGGIFNENLTGFILNKKETLETIDWYSDLANKYNIAPKKSDSANLTMAQLFLQEKIAMHVSGRWLVPKYRKDAKFDWDIIQLPKGKKGSITSIDSSGYALSASSRHKKEAIRFILYISSKNSLEKLTQSGLIVPAIKDIAYSETFINRKLKPENAQAFIDIIDNGKPTPVNSNYQKIIEIINKALEPVFLGKIKAREAISDELLNELKQYAN